MELMGHMDNMGNSTMKHHKMYRLFIPELRHDKDFVFPLNQVDSKRKTSFFQLKSVRVTILK